MLQGVEMCSDKFLGVEQADGIMSKVMLKPVKSELENSSR